MNVFSITHVSNYIDNPVIQSFHANMFHGLAERDNREFPHDPKVWANTESPTSLVVSRTARRVPEISQPSIHLVVSARLAKRLEDLRNIRILPIVFKRLVDVDYEKGDMNWDEAWGDVDPRELLRTLPDVPAFHRSIGRYYEILTWRLQDVAGRYPSAPEVALETGTPPMVETIKVRLSNQMMLDYPMLWKYGEILASEDVFRLLKDSLDRDFFIVRRYEVTG
jgi:hypothetical protein